MYDIGFARKLDKGTSNVEIEGEVTYVLAPNHIEPKPGGKQFNAFWSQFVVLADNTDKIGVSLTFGDEEDQVKKGDRIKVKGKIDEYEDRDGVLQKKLVGREVKDKVVTKEHKNNAKKEIKDELNSVKKDNENKMEELRIKAIELAIKAIEKNIEIKKLLSVAKVLLGNIRGFEVEKKEEKTITKTEPNKVKEEKKKEEVKKDKIEDYLVPIVTEGKKVDLDDWEKIIFFAVENGIFSPGISIDEAKEKLYKEIDCYNALLNEIKVKKEIIGNIPKDDADYSQDIPF